MISLTFQQVFGANATQTANTITFHKADFPTLTATANNRGEQLLAAIVIQALQPFQGVLTDEYDRTITDEYGRTINYDNRNLYEKLNIWFWKRQFINLLQVDSFIIDIFIKPPTEAAILLNPDQVDY